MRLSRKSEYACLALIELARNHGKGLLKTEDIVKKTGIPRKYCEQILLQLKGAGLVRSRRGTEGGYALSREPKEISLAEIVRLIDGALAPVSSVSKYFYEPTPSERNKALVAVMRDIRDKVAAIMERTTLADLCR
jgi:Rrf2 family cysteine metabolism transcriptional repressor